RVGAVGVDRFAHHVAAGEGAALGIGAVDEVVVVVVDAVVADLASRGYAAWIPDALRELAVARVAARIAAVGEAAVAHVRRAADGGEGAGVAGTAARTVAVEVAALLAGAHLAAVAAAVAGAGHVDVAAAIGGEAIGGAIIRAVAEQARAPAGGEQQRKEGDA